MSRVVDTELKYLLANIYNVVVGYPPVSPELFAMQLTSASRYADTILQQGIIPDIMTSRNNSTITGLIENVLADPDSYMVLSYEGIFRINEDGSISELGRDGEFSPVVIYLESAVFKNKPEQEERYYQWRLRNNNKYLCSASGKCELSFADNAVSREECEANCESTENKDILYEILSYSPDALLAYSDSDKQAVLYKLLGKRYNKSATNRLVKLLASNDWSAMRQEKELEEYLEERYDPYQLFFNDVFTAVKIRIGGDSSAFYGDLDVIIDEDGDFYDEGRLQDLFFTERNDSRVRIAPIYLRQLPQLKAYREERR